MIRAMLVIVLIMGATTGARSDAQPVQQTDPGRYLATAGDCIACHTAPGGKPFAGGRDIPTPFGSMVSPNITPDRETGIGAWTDDAFVLAMRNGIGPGGKHYYPAFPYPFFTKMTRDDVLVIRRYLETVDPVRNAVRSNQLPFPFRVRALMIGWNALFFDAGEFKADPTKSGEWNRGAYLVEGPAHCGACHTAKNALGADKKSKAYEGGKSEGWFAPDLTNDQPGGLGTWTVDELAEYLRTGRNKTAAATGPMGEVISLSTSHLTTEDLRAMAMYLKDHQGSRAGVTPAAPDKTLMVAGKDIFEAHCGACHQPSGTGVTGLFPALADAPAVQSDDFSNLIHVVLKGGKSAATRARPTGAAMPPFGWKLSDRQIAAVATYIRNAWGNSASEVSGRDVAAARRELARTAD